MVDGQPQSKEGFEFLRHVSTLAAGAIALQIGFLEKIFPHPKWKVLVAISIVGFTFTIIAGVITQWTMLGIIHAREGDWSNLGGCAVVLMWINFFVGLTSAVVFSLRNLFAL